MIERIAEKRGLDFDGCESAVKSADMWIRHQQALLQVMAEIAELTYTLNEGAISRDGAHALLLPYASQADSSLRGLSEWHGDYMSKLEIDTVASRRRRQGIDAALHSLLALFEDGFRYREVSPTTSEMIRRQRGSVSTTDAGDDRDLYQEDVTLVMKDGVVYYLPPAPGG